MENLGALALLFALCLSVYAVVAALLGKWKDKPYLALSAERSVIGIWVLVATASTTLV